MFKPYQKKAGGPAFPRPYSQEPKQWEKGDHTEYGDEQHGMSLLEFYSANAMVGLVTKSTKAERDADGWEMEVARTAFELGQAMVFESNRLANTQ